MIAENEKKKMTRWRGGPEHVSGEFPSPLSRRRTDAFRLDEQQLIGVRRLNHKVDSGIHDPESLPQDRGGAEDEVWRCHPPASARSIWALQWFDAASLAHLPPRVRRD